MMTIFDFNNYKEYLKQHIQSLPQKGRGEINNIADLLNVNASLVSNVLNTDRQFSMEQAYELTEYLDLKKIEADYFICLVSLEKAGSEKLKKYWEKQRKYILSESQKIKSHIKYQKTLSLEEQTLYYSHVVYSHIRVLSTLEKGISLEELQFATKISKDNLLEAIEFLVQTKLLSQNGDRYFASDKIVHISKDSPAYLQHHKNWRLQQLQNSAFKVSDINYTFPCTLNRKDFDKIKNMLMDAIAKSHKLVQASPAEEMACLTIDWILYSKE